MEESAPVGHKKKGPGILQGRLPEGEPSENNPENSGSSGIGNAPEMGDPGEIGGHPEIGATPDAGIPPELGGPSDRSGTTPADGNPEADGTSPSATGGGSGSADGNASASSSPSESEEKGGFSSWWNKAKNYVTSGQILKDAAHVGKETLDFLVLDDVSGCFTGKDTDGNQMAGWERGLSCVSLVPAAKVAKVGKYADEALAFAGKLDDKLAKTRFGEGLQTAKRKLEDLFSRGKQVACGCNSRNSFLKNIKPPTQNTDEVYESYFETVLGKRLKKVKGTDLALPNSPVNIPGEVLGQWIKDGRIERGIPRKLDNYIKNYESKKIQLDKNLIVTIDKDTMKHILESHHPKHFNPKARITKKGNVKPETTLFPNNMNEKDVEQVLIKLLKQEKNRINKNASEDMYGFQFGKDEEVVVDGVKYVVGFQIEGTSNGMRYRKVGQFYPKVN